MIGSLVNDVGIVEAIRGHEGTLFFEKGGMVLRYQEEIVRINGLLEERARRRADYEKLLKE